MCIRDRAIGERCCRWLVDDALHIKACNLAGRLGGCTLCVVCLLYTSDAADERSSVDLGGRRIIKKKTEQEVAVVGASVRTP